MSRASLSEYPIVVLWTIPRSRSTAFERMMIERGDHHVVDEPYSARYYLSESSLSNRFSEVVPDSEPDEILSRLKEAAKHRPVFVKDMAYQARGLITPEFVGNFTNTFLVREPVSAVASLSLKWPDFTEEEAGYTALLEAFHIVTETTGEKPHVVEADELARNPERTAAEYCKAVGIEFVPDSLNWAPGMADEWVRWQDWYSGVAESTGFQVPRPVPKELPADPRKRAIVERAQLVYHELLAG